MYSLLNEIDKIIWIIKLLSIGLGIINCFWGYKYFKFIIALNGFMFGSIIGGILGLIGAMYLELSDEIIAVTIFTGLICGAVSAIIAYSVYKFGVFIMVFSITFVGTFALLLSDISVFKLLFLDEKDLLGYAFISLIPASIVGGIAVLLIKPTVILTTAISGAYEIAWGIFNDDSLCIIATVFLAAIGIAIQFSINNNTSTKPTAIPCTVKPKYDTTPDITDTSTAYDEKSNTAAEEIDIFSDIGDESEMIVSEPEPVHAIAESKLIFSSDIKERTDSNTYSSSNKSDYTGFSTPNDL